MFVSFLHIQVQRVLVQVHLFSLIVADMNLVHAEPPDKYKGKTRSRLCEKKNVWREKYSNSWNAYCGALFLLQPKSPVEKKKYCGSSIVKNIFPSFWKKNQSFSFGVIILLKLTSRVRNMWNFYLFSRLNFTRSRCQSRGFLIDENQHIWFQWCI